MPEVKSPKRTAGWTKVAFGDVVRLCTERSSDPEADGFERYIGLEHLDPGELRVRRWGDLANGVTFTNVFRPGQVLFGKRRAYQRKVAVADFSGVCSGDIYVLEPKGDALLPELLPFICQTDAFFEHAVGTSAGSLSPRTNWESLADFEFALPPIEEQQRMHSALSAAQVVSEQLEDLITVTRIAHLAAFESMTAQAAASPVELGSILLESPRNGCSAPPSPQATGHWVLALSAISRWGYKAGELKPVEPTEAMKQARIHAGDLVISRSNTRELVGLPAVFSENRTDVSYPDTMMRLRLNPETADVKFVELALRSKSGRRQIQSFAAGTSASMKKINATTIQRLMLPQPPLSIQREIVCQLALVAGQIESATIRRSKAQRVMADLLQTAVVGGGDLQ